MLYKPVSYTAHFQNFSYEKFENLHFLIKNVQHQSLASKKNYHFTGEMEKPGTLLFIRSGVTFHSDKSQIFTTKFLFLGEKFKRNHCLPVLKPC